MPTKSGDQEDATYDGTGLRGQPGHEGQGRNDLHGGGEATGGKRQKPPRPDTIEPCPRCGSSDTKFCYYNNCNVKQPRFFCKTCQRYWTAGGTLRNVPPGSGRRKSKSQAAKESDKPGALAEKLAKQSVASALLSNPAGLAASVPFLNPSLSAESAMLAYNAAAQQQLLGTAALNALSSLPGQWPGTGLTQAADSADGGTPSGNGGTNGQALGLSGEEQHDDTSAPSAKRAKLDSSRIKHEGDGNGGTGMSSLGLSGTPAMGDTSTTAAANNMADLNTNALLQSSQLMPGLRNGWPGLNANDHALLNGMGQGELSGMMGGQNVQQAAVAAQTALQQQHMAYQQMMHAQLLHQQLAAQAQVAAGLGQPNPYLSLQHLAAYNPGWSFPMGNPGLGHLGFNPQG